MRLMGGYASDVGHVRKVNQDAVILKNAMFDDVGIYDPDAHDAGFAVLAVCDGIGGLEHGEISSNIVRSGIEQWCDEILRWINIRTVEPEILYSHLKDAADDWNARVVEFARDTQTPTGTTMSILMLVRDRYFILQVGDSRIYRLQNKVLEQLTIDASVVRYRNGRPKSFLDNFMGKSYELTFTSSSGMLSEEDVFIVCSDGFYHRLEPDDTVRFLEAKTEEGMVGACEELIYKMIERGETDNISGLTVSIK